MHIVMKAHQNMYKQLHVFPSMQVSLGRLKEVYDCTCISKMCMCLFYTDDAVLATDENGILHVDIEETGQGKISGTENMNVLVTL